MTGKQFEVTEEDLKFYEAISPVFNGKKELIPPPMLCPEERRRRRLSFRNERNLYRRKCDRCKKSLISVYSADKPFTVFCKDCWWSDSWDGLRFGRDYDFSRPFFEQFKELQKHVPRLAIINFSEENSDYTNYGFGNKDCYLTFTSDRNEKCFFGTFVWTSFNCLDSLFVIDSQHCSECIDGDKLYECQYCQGCTNCRNCFGCTESRNLKNCFGCVNLVNQEYCFLNEQLRKEEYEKRILQELKDIPAALKKIEDFSKSFPRRALFQLNCENSTGDHLKNCKNVTFAFDGYGAEDSKFISNFPGEIHHCYDFDGAGSIEWCAEIIASGVATNQCFAIDHNWNGANEVYYSSYCSVNSQLFGCVGLRKKKYCILNKQYTKEEYEKLVPKIIEQMRQHQEWGEFFSLSISPFAYNETAAQEKFPLSKAEVQARGLVWKEEEHEVLKVEKIIPAEKLPKDISKIPDDVLNWAIECEVTKKPFRIIPQELAFDRQFKLPLPHLHPDERHRQRSQKRNPQQLWEGTCSKCQKQTPTSFTPENRPEILCETCYLQTV